MYSLHKKNTFYTVSRITLYIFFTDTCILKSLQEHQFELHNQSISEHDSDMVYIITENRDTKHVQKYILTLNCTKLYKDIVLIGCMSYYITVLD